MKNNELQKIKNEKLKFLMLRKEIIGSSCREVKVPTLKYRNFLSKYPEHKGNPEFENPSIKDHIMEELESTGFDLKDNGSKYLANLILMFFHERKLYRRGDIPNKNYWDLDAPSNEHYKMFGIPPENFISCIQNSIDKNENTSGCSIGEIVYNIADYVGYYGKDKDDKKRSPYINLLKRNRDN